MAKESSRIRIYGLVMGGVAALITLSYFVAILNVPIDVPPSSTDGVAYVLIPIYAFFIGFIGYVTGLLVVWVIDLILSKTKIVQRGTLIKISACLIIIVGYWYYANDKYLNAKSDREEFNAKNTPGVKYDAGIIQKKHINENDLTNYDLDLNKNHAIGYIGGEYLEKQKDFIWNEKKYLIEFNSNGHILILNDDGSIFIDHSLDGYSYINGITYLVFENNSYLFILSRLRATSSMSVLNVFSKEGKMIYEELLGRNNIIESGQVNGEKVVMVGNKDRRADEIIESVRDFIYKIKK